ncbi:MAG: hypothetical protein AB8H86_25090 [Polyangiales bacterium]
MTMNDNELDELLRGIPGPSAPDELAQARKVPIAELVVFSLLTLALLSWVCGVLSQVFGT